MMTNKEVEAALDKIQPPDDLFEQMARQKDGFAKNTVLAFKRISNAEAQGLAARDARCTDDPPAVLWCSACEQAGVVNWRGYKGPEERPCHNAWVPYEKRRIVLDHLYNKNGMEVREEGDGIACPWCGAKGTLRHREYMRQGVCEQLIPTVPYVLGEALLLVQWIAEERIVPNGIAWRKMCTVLPLRAWLVEERGVRVWAKAVRRYGSCFERLSGWEPRQYNGDRLATPYFYTRRPPKLDGTWLENSKLWQWMRETYDLETFAPLAYLALYRKHRNTEVLVTAGCGALLGRWLKKECAVQDWYSSAARYKAPKLAWVQWKQRRPSAMLGLTRQQLRECLGAQCNDTAKTVYIRNGAAQGLSMEECAALCNWCDEYCLLEMMAQCKALPGGLQKGIRYLQKQKKSWSFLHDYWDMQAKLGVDLDADAALRWPKNLLAAHDRAAAALKYEKDKRKEAAFARMTDRLRGLCWAHDGICIRPAESIRELVEEGQVLHHCVGGYGDAHCAGRCIFFIRNERRPERSWYTLQVDVANKRVLQNHGYKNEYVGGRVRKIPRAVEEFVAAWQREVLAKWTLPMDKKPKKEARAKAGRAA